MRKLVHVASVLLAALSGCPGQPSSPEGRQLSLEADEVIVHPPMVEVVGDLGPPIARAEGLNGCGAADFRVAAAEPAGCLDGVDATALPIDVDGDGVRAEADCDDLDPTVSPEEPEIPCNGVDENCNGVDDCDRDGDGYRDIDDPNPGVPEVEPLGRPDPPRWP